METGSGQGDRRVEMDEAISHHRKALEQTGSPALRNLAAALMARFGETGQLEDVEEAVALYREAIEVQDIPRSESSLNLAAALQTRFDWTGRLADLDEAVVLNREALELCRASNADPSYALSSLAKSLQSRFDATNRHDDLNAAHDLYQEALDLRPVSHPHRSVSLHNLAFAILLVFRHANGSKESVATAILLIQEAIKLQPSPRLDTLHCLAEAIHEQSYIDESDDSDDPDQLVPAARMEEAILRMEEAIALNWKAIELLPAYHPNRASLFHNLAQNLLLLSESSETPLHVLADALKASQESVSLLSKGHPAHCRYSMHVGKILMEMYQHGLLEVDASNEDDDWTDNDDRTDDDNWTDDDVSIKGDSARCVDDAIAAFRLATSCESAPVWHRFQAATEWATATSTHAHRHHSACEAYQTAIELRTRLAPLHLNLQSRKDALETEDSLLREAISSAVQLGRLDKAVEFFEGRRAIFWSQAQQLRPPLDELRIVAPELAQKLECLSRALEQGSFRPNSSDTPQNIILKEREDMHYSRLYEDWLMTVAGVRRLNGFEGFLLPKSFSLLQNAAANGPVIILIPADMNDNGLYDRSMALVVTLSGVKNLSLPLLTSELADDLSELTRQVIDPENDDRPVKKSYLDSLLKKFLPLRRLLGQPRTSRKASRRAGRLTKLDPTPIANSEDIFHCVLAVLWKVLVEPVIRSLDFEKSESLPRLWWCPTGILGQLPIHAAGIYGVDQSECVSDYVVSSYTPSLGALLIPPPLATDPLKAMVVIQPQTPGYHMLPCTLDELNVVKKYMSNESLATLAIFGTPGAPAIVENVLSCLSTVSIAHFACHGEAVPESLLDSAFILHDGQKLKLSHVMELTTPNASLAFLCACHTAKTDQDDEVVNLAATLLFAGFRGAVATMWSIDDEDGPTVAESFYRHLFQRNESAAKGVPRLDITQAALALHVAVSELRSSKKCPFKRWVPFIHFGL